MLLTPSALERCNEPADWLRREIETALANKRNIVPLMLEGFDFGTPTIASQLTGKLATLKSYNALGVPAEYFMEAMDRLRERFLNVPLEGVLHPASPSAERAAKRQQAAADTAPAVQEEELTAQQWFERGFDTKDLDEKIRFYSQAIRLKPDYAAPSTTGALRAMTRATWRAHCRITTKPSASSPIHSEAFNNRGIARKAKGDLEGALQDYNEAIRLKPDYADAFNNRGNARRQGRSGRRAAGLRRGYPAQARLCRAFNNRGLARKAKGDLEGALQDYNEAIRLKPDDADLSTTGALRAATKAIWRGRCRITTRPSGSSQTMPTPSTTGALRGTTKAIWMGALQDYNEAIRLKPDYADAFNNRGNCAPRQRATLRARCRITTRPSASSPTMPSPSTTGAMRAEPKATWRARCRITTRPSASSPTMPTPSTTGVLRARAKGDLEGALQDYNEAIRLKPDYANAYYNRADHIPRQSELRSRDCGFSEIPRPRSRREGR